MTTLNPTERAALARLVQRQAIDLPRLAWADRAEMMLRWLSSWLEFYRYADDGEETNDDMVDVIDAIDALLAEADAQKETA